MRKGKLSIFPEIVDGNSIAVTIIGDSPGLRYLANLLVQAAQIDQEKENIPHGERYHIHLHYNEHLDGHSCEVEICRADAKGTGELPDFMKD
jgi:hypothetical protein